MSVLKRIKRAVELSEKKRALEVAKRKKKLRAVTVVAQSKVRR